MLETASAGDPAIEPDILERYVGMTYDEAMRRHADQMDWEGILSTTAAALGKLENVPFAGVALKAISRTVELYDTLKRHKRRLNAVMEKLYDLRSYLERLHGKLPQDEGLLKRTAEVVLGGMVLIHAINKPFDVPRSRFR
jgi:hypothetical protein